MAKKINIIERLQNKLEEAWLKSKFAEANGSVKYVIDIETNEILWINDTGKRLFGDVVGEKCYEVFQDFNHTCNFCTNDNLTKDGDVYQWTHFNEKIGRFFLVRDWMVINDGRKLRFESAIDITDNFEKHGR